MADSLNSCTLQSLQRIYIWGNFRISEECSGFSLLPSEDPLWGWRNETDYASQGCLRNPWSWPRAPPPASMVPHPKDTQTREEGLYLNPDSHKTRFSDALGLKISAPVWNLLTHTAWFIKPKYRAHLIITQITTAIVESNEWMYFIRR